MDRQDRRSKAYFAGVVQWGQHCGTAGRLEVMTVWTQTRTQVQTQVVVPGPIVIVVDTVAVAVTVVVVVVVVDTVAVAVIVVVVVVVVDTVTAVVVLEGAYIGRWGWGREVDNSLVVVVGSLVVGVVVVGVQLGVGVGVGPLDWVGLGLIVDYVDRVSFRFFSYRVLKIVPHFVVSYDSMMILCSQVEVSLVPFGYPQVLVYLSKFVPICVPLEDVFRET